jgi:hypothetical protein
MAFPLGKFTVKEEPVALVSRLMPCLFRGPPVTDPFTVIVQGTLEYTIAQMFKELSPNDPVILPLIVNGPAAPITMAAIEAVVVDTPMMFPLIVAPDVAVILTVPPLLNVPAFASTMALSVLPFPSSNLPVPA